MLIWIVECDTPSDSLPYTFAEYRFLIKSKPSCRILQNDPTESGKESFQTRTQRCQMHQLLLRALAHGSAASLALCFPTALQPICLLHSCYKSICHAQSLRDSMLH